MTFEIYIPKGTQLNLKDIRKSTWMHPLIGGEEAMKLIGEKGTLYLDSLSINPLWQNHISFNF